MSLSISEGANPRAQSAAQLLDAMKGNAFMENYKEYARKRLTVAGLSGLQVEFEAGKPDVRYRELRGILLNGARAEYIFYRASPGEFARYRPAAAAAIRSFRPGKKLSEAEAKAADVKKSQSTLDELDALDKELDKTEARQKQTEDELAKGPPAEARRSPPPKEIKLPSKFDGSEVQRMAMEGATTANLGVLLSDVTLYYGDHEGSYPADLARAVGAQGGSIPAVKIADHPHTDGVQIYGNEVCAGGFIDGSKLRDTGKWGYVSDAKSKCWGAVFVDCVHEDLKGRPWYTKGQ